MVSFGDATSAELPDPLVLRQGIDVATPAASESLPWPQGMQESSHQVQSLDGTAFEVAQYVPQALATQASAGPQRAVIFVFGGGMIAGSVASYRRFASTLAEASASQVFVVGWRLAPENPYPAGVEDVYSTLLWLQASSDRLNVDPARIVMFGISAGANLATAVALMARDKALSPPVVAQCLRYPMIDDQTALDPSDPRHATLTWPVPSNDAGWKAYLGRDRADRNDENTPYYAAPARAKDLSGMPPTNIGVGSLDMFREECIKYASDLARKGVDTTLRVYPGAPHGFDMFTHAELGAEMREDEARFIKRF